MERKQFFKNAGLFACTSLVLRIAGVLFNVYVTNQIGSEGIGLFGLLSSVHIFAATIAASGISLATTRLVTEERSLSCDLGIIKVMNRCLAYSLFFGVLSFLLLRLFASFISLRCLGDIRTLRPLSLLALSLPFSALSAAINGYLIAVKQVARSASAQLLELFVKILVILSIFKLSPPGETESACLSLVLGNTVSEIVSCLYLYILYRLHIKTLVNNREKKRHYTSRLFHLSLPLAVSSYLRSGLVSLEHVLIPMGLKRFGASSSASLSQYGIVHGMVMPILLFPSSILSAFASLLIPELSDLQTRKKEKGINRIASKAFRSALSFSIAAATILHAYADELGMALYNSGDAALFIRFLAPLVVVMYLDNVTDAILKGLNQQVYSMRYNIIDSALSVILILLLLPRFGINGYIFVIYATELVNAFLSINRLFTVTNFSFSPLRSLFLPLFSALLSAVSGKFLLARWSLSFKLSLCLSIATSLSLYLILLWSFPFLSRLRRYVPHISPSPPQARPRSRLRYTDDARL